MKPASLSGVMSHQVNPNGECSVSQGWKDLRVGDEQDSLDGSDSLPTCDFLHDLDIERKDV